MKQLITAETIRAKHAANENRLVITRHGHIVTPEARSVAEELGVNIELQDEAGTAGDSRSGGNQVCEAKTRNEDVEKIRAEILSRLPSGAASPELVDQLINKMLAEQKAASAQTATAADKTPSYASDKLPSGIKRIKGDSIRMGIFDGAGEENQVGIVDIVTSEDGSSIAAGFMSWEKCFFPWTLTYDEVNIVLEGELHIRSEGQTLVAKQGDVFFIPKNSSIEFGTPTHVRMLYVAYPANWSG